MSEERLLAFIRRAICLEADSNVKREMREFLGVGGECRAMVIRCIAAQAFPASFRKPAWAGVLRRCHGTRHRGSDPHAQLLAVDAVSYWFWMQEQTSE